MANSAPAPHEIVLPYPEAMREVVSFRTTWLTSSIAALKELGYLERYLAQLPREYHETVLTSVVGTWVPVQIAIEHYAACERLSLPHDQIVDIGRSVTRRVHGTSLSLAVRLAKRGGVTPWVALAQLNRLWERIWEGGGVRVQKLGNKDALIEIGGWQPASSTYVHVAMPAVIEALIELFCRRAFARKGHYTRDGTLIVEASWA